LKKRYLILCLTMLSCVGVCTGAKVNTDLPVEKKEDFLNQLEDSPILSVVIDVNSKGYNTPFGITAKAEGTAVEALTDEQISAMGLTQSYLVEATKIQVGWLDGITPVIFLKDPVADLHGKDDNWFHNTDRQPATIVTQAVDAKVVSNTAVPTIIQTLKFQNNTTNTATYTASFNHKMSTSMTTSWSSSSSYTAGASVTAKAEFAGCGVSGTASLSVDTANKHGGSVTRTDEMNTGGAVDVPVKPGQTVYAHLCCSTGSLKINVTYSLTPAGFFLAVSHKKNPDSIVDWWRQFKRICPTLGNQVQTIEIKCFSDSSIVLSEKNAEEMQAMMLESEYYQNTEEKKTEDVPNTVSVEEVPDSKKL